MPYWFLSQYLKHRVKSAVSFISAFETAMLTEVRRRNCDGVVCGHIHKPEMREVDGLIYANDGDWVESLSALVEHHDGTLELLDWQNAERTQTWQVRSEPLPRPNMPSQRWVRKSKIAIVTDPGTADQRGRAHLDKDPRGP